MATNEFDFDELDKAVSSLMKDGESDAEPTTTSAQQPAVVSPQPTVPTPLIEQPILPTAPVIEAQPPVVTPSPAAQPDENAAVQQPKRSGRFMDVVHPSSDMTTPPAPSREGVSLAPPSTPPVSVPEPALTPSASLGLTTEPPQPEPSPPVDVSTPNDAPLTSPFLPNTQVEKRPLGGAGPNESLPSLDAAIAAELSGSSDTPAPQPEQTPEPETTTTVEEETIATPDTEATTEPPQKEYTALPEELSGDLVAIESGDVQEADTVEPEETAETITEPDTTPAPNPALLGHSIPQQYEEQASSGDASHAPIYDEQSASSPLVKPAKKKTGLIIMSAIGLIVLGILGALGLYFLQLGS